MFTIIFNVYVCFFISALLSKQHFVDFIAKTKSLYCISQSFMVKLCVLCMCAARCVCVCGGKMGRRQRRELMTTRQSTLSALTASHRVHWGWCHLCQPPAVDLMEKLALLKKSCVLPSFFLAVETEKKNHLHVGLITSLFAYFMICHCDFTQSYVLKFFSTSKQQLSCWAQKLKFLLGNHWEQKLLCFE